MSSRILESDAARERQIANQLSIHASNTEAEKKKKRGANISLHNSKCLKFCTSKHDENLRLCAHIIRTSCVRFAATPTGEGHSLPARYFCLACKYEFMTTHVHILCTHTHTHTNTDKHTRPRCKNSVMTTQ